MRRIAVDARLLGYLHVRGDPKAEALAHQLCSEAQSLVEVSHWRERVEWADFAGQFAPFIDASNDLARHVENATAVWMFAVSLGHGLESRVSELFRLGRNTQAYLLDRLGNYLVEREISAVDVELRGIEKTRNSITGRRFSPGFGDIPLALQSVFIRKLKKPFHDISISDAYVLSPEKTVTAFKVVFPMSRLQ